ncbi:MAG: Dipeptidyl aminopeptidase BII [Candidatus Marinimicrobia bacterium]|nr:Dipeptidyl aminopeptidase BII [Candidatus Neomarinimicrobiota bacterium]
MRRIFILLFISLFSVVPLSAEEGMWLLNQLPMKTLESAGLQLHQGNIYQPDKPSISDAIVQIGGGTGSIVSESGLVITNHHVAHSGLQMVSDSANNYVEAGYSATNRGEEIYVPGYKAYLAVEFTDVTKEIKSGITDDMNPEERVNTIDDAIKQMEEKYESEAENIYHYDVSEFYDGHEYYLFKYLEFKDIRLVYAPPASIGNYGGDIDNWMWPRHTGDFAFFRLYTNPDMTNSEHSDENVPYQPKQYLKFTDDGVKKGDFTFILGYPGGTQRFRTSYSVKYAVNQSYPFQIDMYENALDIIDEETRENESLQITYADRKASMKNYYKNFHGMLEGLTRADLLQIKKNQEADFQKWVVQKRSRKKQYGDVLDEIEEIYAVRDSVFPQPALIKSMSWLTRTYYAASVMDKWSLEKEKPNLERESYYMERNLPRLKERLKLMQRQFDPAVDKEIMKYFLTELYNLPPELQVEPIATIPANYTNLSPEEAISNFVDSLYANTQLTKTDRRMGIFDMSREEMRNLNDSMLDFAMDLRPFKDQLDEFDKRIEGQLNRLRPAYIQGLQAWMGGDIYPDANFTPRFTYGDVKGYSPEDAVNYDYITSVNGIAQKHTGEDPFDAPEKLLSLIENGDFPEQYVDSYLGTVPVDFLHTTDITGGNSGSPVMDAQGRFIGIAFDGNWESISADWVFNPDLTRSISVDARYILFILDEFAENEYVLDELRVE